MATPVHVVESRSVKIGEKTVMYKIIRNPFSAYRTPYGQKASNPILNIRS